VFTARMRRNFRLNWKGRLVEGEVEADPILGSRAPKITVRSSSKTSDGSRRGWKAGERRPSVM
jgi:hypothetical protein